MRLSCKDVFKAHPSGIELKVSIKMNELFYAKNSVISPSGFIGGVSIRLLLDKDLMASEKEGTYTIFGIYFK